MPRKSLVMLVNLHVGQGNSLDLQASTGGAAVPSADGQGAWGGKEAAHSWLGTAVRARIGTCARWVHAGARSQAHEACKPAQANALGFAGRRVQPPLLPLHRELGQGPERGGTSALLAWGVMLSLTLHSHPATQFQLL